MSKSGTSYPSWYDDQWVILTLEWAEWLLEFADKDEMDHLLESCDFEVEDGEDGPIYIDGTIEYSDPKNAVRNYISDMSSKELTKLFRNAGFYF